MSAVGKQRLALIPARSGSKGLRDKNVRAVGGRSLLSRAIETARESGLFDRIFVSTDSRAYAEEAARAEVETPWLRPAELATDTALVADMIRHTLEAFRDRGEEFSTVALLEPTSPLRRTTHVAAVVAAAEEDGWDAAFTVSRVPVRYHYLKQFRVEHDGTARLAVGEASPNVNRQSLDPTFIRNGLAYAVRAAAFLETGSIHGTRARAIEVTEPAVSIDSEEDFTLAEALLHARSEEEQ